MENPLDTKLLSFFISTTENIHVSEGKKKSRQSTIAQSITKGKKCKYTCKSTSSENYNLKCNTFNTCVASSKGNNQCFEKSANFSRSFDYLSLPQRHERYFNILSEVKKILKKDIISRRKIKSVFKKQRFCLTASSIKLHSSGKDNENRIEFDSFQHLQYRIKEKINENLNKYHYSPKKIVVKDFEISCNDKTVCNKTLSSSTIIVNTSPNSDLSSRTPSPALPLMRDEAILNRNLNNIMDKLPFVKEIDDSKTLNSVESKAWKCSKYTKKYKKYLRITKDISDTSKSSLTSKSPYSPIIISFKENKDLNLISRNNIREAKFISPHQTTHNLQTNSYRQSLSPLRISSSISQKSPILLLQSMNSTTLLKKDLMTLKSKKASVSNSLESSSKRSSSAELSNFKTIQINSYMNGCSNISKNINRSLSPLRTPSRLTRSLSRNSRDKQKRSCSKDSTYTFISSERCSRNSFSSSRSISTLSSSTSRFPSSTSSRTRSPSIPRRYGSPSFLDRRRITSARKRPIPYHRPTPSPLSSPSSNASSNSSNWSSQTCKLSEKSNSSSPYLVN